MTSNKKWTPGRLATTSALTAAIGLVGMPTLAGNHWLSRATVFTTTGDEVTVTPMNGAALANLPAGTKSANAVFDIVISLEDNPPGDDDSKADPGTADDAQNLYEERIRQFANAVFEATNGKHKIRRVTVYRNYDQRNLADVQWEKDCTDTANGGPWAFAGGFQKAGKYIHMCTTWTGAAAMPTPKGSGYTLAHEWGHYAYNVYDEYSADQCKLDITTMFGLTCPAWEPRATDTVSDSIMHMQWYAVSGNVRPGYAGASADYLEFSTPDHAPYNVPLVDPETGDTSIGRTGHERYFGESIWETLTRDPATDPTYPGLDRTQYTNLIAPEAPNWRVSNGIAGALSELDIRWASDQVAELVIDRSGSMGGTPLISAKLGAGVLIAQLPAGDSAIGVGSFATDVAQDFAITDIPDPDTGVKSAATAAVNALVANGQTSLYDGLISALVQINAYNAANGNRREAVVYVLADGGNNDSTADEAEVIAEYQKSGVPIVAFGYGTGAPTITLAKMASETGGLYLQSPTTTSEITAAFLSANAAFSNNSLILNKKVSATGSAQTTTSVPIDSTLKTVTIAVTFDGNSGDMNLRLLDPSGTDTGAVFTCSGAAACIGELNNAALTNGGSGDYTLEINSAALTDLDLTIIASGSPKAGQGYSIAVSVGGSNTTFYPAPMLIEATVRADTPITGLNVVATIAEPSSAVTPVQLTLKDDGTDGDVVADDGTYTGSYHYKSTGTHSITVVADNKAGDGQTTTEGVSVSLRQDGTAVLPPPSDVTENFIRTSTSASVVSAVSTDDHSNDPKVPAACTSISDGNIRTMGRIDKAGDVDCFIFKPDSTRAALVVRATGLSGGMSPTVTVYNGTGTAKLVSATLAKSENRTVGTVVSIPSSSISLSGHVVTVKHGNSSAAKGNYEISVGVPQVSDVAQVEGNGNGDPSPSGGAIGPWGVFVLGLLGLIGLYQRRR